MQILNLEQNTPEWLKARAGVITGTGLGNIMKGGYNKDGSLNATAKKAMLNYLYELLGGEFSYDEEAPEVNTYLMSKGHELEEIAKIHYEEKKGLKGKDVGFIKKNDWQGLSPDWCIFDGDKIKKCIEIKSPLGSNSKNFFKYMFEDKIPDDYIWQVVQYFLVIDDLEELDFVVFNPNFILKDKQLWIKTVTRKDLEKQINEAKKRIKIFRTAWEKAIKHLLKGEEFTLDFN